MHRDVPDELYSARSGTKIKGLGVLDRLQPTINYQLHPSHHAPRTAQNSGEQETTYALQRLLKSWTARCMGTKDPTQVIVRQSPKPEAAGGKRILKHHWYMIALLILLPNLLHYCRLM
jgi:hypothetical protein